VRSLPRFACAGQPVVGRLELQQQYINKYIDLSIHIYLGITNNDDLEGGDGVFDCEAVVAPLAVLFVCVFVGGVVLAVCACMCPV